MTAIENAKKFFEACDAAEGWSACKDYVADGASFVAQSEPIADINTVEAYCEWMAGFGTVTVPGETYDMHTTSYDEETNTALLGRGNHWADCDICSSTWRKHGSERDGSKNGYRFGQAGIR